MIDGIEQRLLQVDADAGHRRFVAQTQPDEIASQMSD